MSRRKHLGWLALVADTHVLAGTMRLDFVILLGVYLIEAAKNYAISIRIGFYAYLRRTVRCQ